MNWKMNLKIGSYNTILLSLLVLIFVTACFSRLEEDLKVPLLAHEFDNHIADADRQLKDLYSGSGFGKSLVRTQAKIYNGIVTTLCEKLEQLWESRTLRPQSAETHNWKIHYEIAPRALYQDHKIPELEALVKAVTGLDMNSPQKCTPLTR